MSGGGVPGLLSNRAGGLFPFLCGVVLFETETRVCGRSKANKQARASPSRSCLVLSAGVTCSSRSMTATSKGCVSSVVSSTNKAARSPDELSWARETSCNVASRSPSAFGRPRPRIHATEPSPPPPKLVMTCNEAVAALSTYWSSPGPIEMHKQRRQAPLIQVFIRDRSSL